MPRRAAIRPVADEFADAELGDARLTRRLVTVAEMAATTPDASFPRLSGSDGELEGVYRFFSNERVNAPAILEPHVLETLKRASAVKRTLVIHDTTSFLFGGTSPREGLGWIHKQGVSQGFFGHFALAVTGDHERRPLGVAGMIPVVRSGTPLGRRSSARARYQRAVKESQRWSLLAAMVHDRLPHAIHVMDREADSFDIYEGLARLGASFVIRARESDNRIAIVDDKRTPVGELKKDQVVRLTRTVQLSRRLPTQMTARNKIHPPRSERTATLEVRSSAIAVPRPTNQSRFTLPRHLDFNVVWVTETHPPRGQEPVSWTLITDLPVATADEVAAVVDAYRARWMIEEFFKALKTGCAFEKRQLESLHALKNALAVFAVIAWRLLLLRTLSRSEPKAPATRAVTSRQLQLLQQLSELNDPRFRRVHLPARPTCGDALMAIAGLGGHLKNNGMPGWQVLGRGYDALLLLELGWRARDAM